MASTSPARISVWSDYVCPFCYLELPVLVRLQAEHAEEVEIDWRAFELRPEPAPTLDPNGDYLHRVWNQSVYPMAEQRGMVLRLPPVQPRSRKAFEAAEFAREVGRFDPMNRACSRPSLRTDRISQMWTFYLESGAPSDLMQKRCIKPSARADTQVRS
jgi:predicted DsbA family dithiol-disulfide isomerase